MLVGRVAIHTNANRVEEWAERSHEIQQIKIQNPYIHTLIYKIFVYKIFKIQIKKTKSGQENSMQQCRQGGEKLMNSFAPKDPGNLVYSRLNMSQHCDGEEYHRLGSIGSNKASKCLFPSTWHL